MSLGVCQYNFFFLLFFFLEDDSYSPKEERSGSQGLPGSGGACSGIGRFSTIGICTGDKELSPTSGGALESFSPLMDLRSYLLLHTKDISFPIEKRPGTRCVFIRISMLLFVPAKVYVPGLQAEVFYVDPCSFLYRKENLSRGYNWKGTLVFWYDSKTSTTATSEQYMTCGRSL